MVAARQAALAAAAAASGTVGGVAPLAPMAATARPSEMFYARLVPALAEAGVTGGLMAPRKEWPVPALKKVGGLFDAAGVGSECGEWVRGTYVIGWSSEIRADAYNFAIVG